MYLKDLFRYRTTNAKENREDFLSACLAELMRRDASVCKATLQAVGFKDVPDLASGDYTVRTQVGHADGAKMRFCDILVKLRKGPPWIIECKVDAHPDPAQIKRYRRLWRTEHVALLAPDWAIPSTRPWSTVPRGSWQGLWAAIAKLSKPEPEGSFHDAFLDLMSHLGLESRRHLSALEIADAHKAWHRQAPLRAAMREAVLALLPQGLIPVHEADGAQDGYDGARWRVSRPLNCFWTRDRLGDGVPLRGLGLEARLMEGVGSEGALEWVLWIRPTTAGTASLKRAQKEDPTWSQDGDEWEHPLGDTGGPDTPFDEQRRKAVVEARQWLRRGLDVSVGAVALTPSDILLTGNQAAGDAKQAEAFEDTLLAWGSHLSELVADDLIKRLKKSVKARVINDTARVIHGGSERVWFGWEWDITSDPAWFDLLVGWYTIQECEEARGALRDWKLPSGVTPRDYDQYGRRYRVELKDRDLASAIRLLADTARSLLDHDEQVVLRLLKVAR